MNTISIAQISNSGLKEEIIAIYDSESLKLRMLKSFKAGNKPCGTILKIHYSDHNMTLHTSVVASVYFLLFTFFTIVFILYIYFHKEPEIKATSVTVSLSMFLACYILISYLPLLLAEIRNPNNFQCHLLVWFSLSGIPLF